METVTVTHDDGTIDIRQVAPVAEALDAPQLEELYWDEVRRATFGLIGFSGNALRLLGVWPAVLRFGPAAEGRRAILGGLAARGPGGEIAWRADGEHASVAVEGFAPLLRGPLWRLESAFHDLVGRRFLARIAREAR